MLECKWTAKHSLFMIFTLFFNCDVEEEGKVMTISQEGGIAQRGASAAWVSQALCCVT